MTHLPPAGASDDDVPPDAHGWVELEAFAHPLGYRRRWALAEYEAGRLQARRIGRRMMTRREWIDDWTADRLAEGEAS